jgi:hypothetical protein
VWNKERERERRRRFVDVGERGFLRNFSLKIFFELQVHFVYFYTGPTQRKREKCNPSFLPHRRELKGSSSS